MLYREIISVCCQIHTKHINTQCGQNANHKELSLDLLHNVESVCFFYSNPVYIYIYIYMCVCVCVSIYIYKCTETFRTSPPLRHRVPSHFNWTLPQPKCTATFRTHCVCVYIYKTLRNFQQFCNMQETKTLSHCFIKLSAT